MHQAQWSPERPLPPPVSLASQSHHEKPPELTCTSRGNPGFPASTRERHRETFFNTSRGHIPLPHATFQEQMKPPPEPEGRYQPKYVALRASSTTRKAGESPALVLLYPEEPDGDGLTMDLCRECEAEAIAAMLRDYVDRGVWTVSDRPKTPDGAPILRPAAFGD